jgi:uncharacterized membrane protein YqjE
METPSEPPPGILSSLKRLLQTLVAIAGNRAELFAVEVREESARWLTALLLVAALAALGTLTLALITLTIVVLCWPDHQVAALVGLSVVYLAATAIVAARLWWRIHHWPTFSATIAELKKDKSWLEEKH